MFGFMAFLLLSGWTSLPFLWANPFDGDDDGECSNPNVLSMVVTMQLLFLFASQCFCLPMHYRTCTVLQSVILFAMLLMLVEVSLGIAVVALHVTCDGESRTFALSVPVMVLVLPVLGLAVVFVTSYGQALLNCGSSCMRNRPVTRSARVAPAVHVPAAQKLLREAVILGDTALVDLLVDVHGRKRQPLWRLCRCLRLSFAHCQWRCSCCARRITSAHSGGEADGVSSAEEPVPRATLSFVYEDDNADLPIHYLARGARHQDLAIRNLSQPPGWRSWLCRQRRLSQILPQFTDLGRACVLNMLFESGKLKMDTLLALNLKGQTCLHCAASTGSHRVLQELVDNLPPNDLLRTDIDGRTPCEVALEGGHLECAHMLLGHDMSGLSRLYQARNIVRDILGRALGDLRHMGHRETAHDESSTDAVYEGSAEVLHHFEQSLVELRQRTSAELPREACEALLRFHRFNVDAAVAAYSHDARQALDEAGLRDVAVTLEPVDATLPNEPKNVTQASDRCMVCFDNVTGSSFCHNLACKHPTCNECLQQHVAMQLAEGDISSIICPEPACRLPISLEMVGQMFGDPSEEVSKLQVLKAQKYVDLLETTTWCPKPGCTRIVSIRSDGHGPSAPTSVTCACGTLFCFSCKELNGHEPVSCRDWAAWLKELAELRKQMDDASRLWVESNSQQCTCGAQIQRNGGCNHMHCRCGREFCYVCGQDWASHFSQTGGLDHYNCRLTPTARPRPEVRGKARMRPCLTGWMANERNLSRQQALISALFLVCDKFAPGSSTLKVVLQEGSSACLKARQLLQRCYVLRYYWGEAEWRVSIERLVGELEGAVGALEHVLGLAQLEALVTQRSPDLPNLPPEPEELLRGLDVRTLVPHMIAAVEVVGATQQLITAVVLQRARLLGASKVHILGTISDFAYSAQCWPSSSAGPGRGLAILDGCTLM